MDIFYLTVQQESFHKTLLDLTKYVLISERNYILSPFMNFPEALPQINHCIKWKVKNTILPHILEFLAVRNGTNNFLIGTLHFTLIFFLRSAPERMLIKLQITTSCMKIYTIIHFAVKVSFVVRCPYQEFVFNTWNNFK